MRTRWPIADTALAVGGLGTSTKLLVTEVGFGMAAAVIAIFAAGERRGQLVCTC